MVVVVLLWLWLWLWLVVVTRTTVVYWRVSGPPFARWGCFADAYVLTTDRSCVHVCARVSLVLCCSQAKFAFNKLQRTYLPEVYKPPSNIVGDKEVLPT